MAAMGIYEELGVRAFINARAPYTRFGGAIMHEDVTAAMAEAARFGVHLAELQEKVGKAIARMTNNEAAYVSCGAASGITLAVATCMAGRDEALADRLPDTTGMRNHVLMHACHRGTECDTAIRCSGATIVNIGDQNGTSEQQLIDALENNDRVAAAMLLMGDAPILVPTARIVEIAHARNVPVLIDGADAVPPRANLWRWTRDAGADAIIVSGGKGICGPQSTGLVLGKQSIIDGCAFHGVPNIRLGRGMKVGKEEMAGIYAAVKRTMSIDDDTAMAAHIRQADAIMHGLSDLPGVTLTRQRPTWIHIGFPESMIGMTYAEAYDWFQAQDPPILMGGARDGISFATGVLQPGQENAIIAHFRRLLSKNPKT
jgi:L-seryl-tRNA(Ser) seleniumtransferase